MSSSIETGNRALTETKMMPMRERQVVDIVHIDVHSSRGDFVQQRLPNVRGELIDKRDFRPVFPPELVAQRARKRQPAGTAADDDDAMFCFRHICPAAVIACRQRPPRASAHRCAPSARSR